MELSNRQKEHINLIKSDMPKYNKVYNSYGSLFAKPYEESLKLVSLLEENDKTSQTRRKTSNLWDLFIGCANEELEYEVYGMLWCALLAMELSEVDLLNENIGHLKLMSALGNQTAILILPYKMFLEKANEET